MYTITREHLKEAAIVTMVEVWSCIDWERVDSKRAYGIWDEFTSKVKAAAMTTNRYETFVEKLCKKMDVRSVRHRSISDISAQSEEFKAGVLKIIREETTLLVLEVRLNNEIRKEMNKHIKEQERKKKELENRYNTTNITFGKLEGVEIIDE